LGNDAVVLVGFQNDVRLYPLFQIFFAYYLGSKRYIQA
jgi:hypothetical protein